MASPKITSTLALHCLLIALLITTTAVATASPPLFREYLGAEFRNVTFADVPVDPAVDFHFILSFAIDYTADVPPRPADGWFSVFWDNASLSPADVTAVKGNHGNVKVALSLAGDTVNGVNASFAASSVDAWVCNAVESLTGIVRRYDLDGVDVDYEHFDVPPDVFAECVGRLLQRLKAAGVISFASIAPFARADVQSHYLELWKRYGYVIDYVNFQFYAYNATTTVAQFLGYFDEQSRSYDGGRVLVSFGTDPSSAGLTPDRGFFEACEALRRQGRLHGIFVWSADNSKAAGFRHERRAQSFLAAAAGYA